MLATLTDERFSREGWLFEPKWDGERCLAFRRGRNLLNQAVLDTVNASGEVFLFRTPK
jgi:hypothetical protein